jgi:hypothetical protein
MITSDKLFLQSLPKVIRVVNSLLKKKSLLLSMMTANDDDFVVVLLLLSSQYPLIASLLSEANLKQFLPLSEICRKDHRIPRCALLHPDASPFRRFYLSGNDQSFITFTGLDNQTVS